MHRLVDKYGQQRETHYRLVIAVGSILVVDTLVERGSRLPFVSIRRETVSICFSILDGTIADGDGRVQRRAGKVGFVHGYILGFGNDGGRGWNGGSKLVNKAPCHSDAA